MPESRALLLAIARELNSRRPTPFQSDLSRRWTARPAAAVGAGMRALNLAWTESHAMPTKRSGPAVSFQPGDRATRTGSMWSCSFAERRSKLARPPFARPLRCADQLSARSSAYLRRLKTEAYLAHRLRVAGIGAGLFPADVAPALPTITSRGVPRLSKPERASRFARPGTDDHARQQLPQYRAAAIDTPRVGTPDC